MRLFRKNKAAAREPAITAVSVGSMESAALKPSSPPPLAQAPLPALQLDLDLPALTQGTLGFSSSIAAEDHADSHMHIESSEQQARQVSTDAGNYEIHPAATPSNLIMSSTQLNGEGASNLCGSYDFDLGMIQLIGNSSNSGPQDPKSQVQNQLLEQFGLGNLSLSSGTATPTRAAGANNADPLLAPWDPSYKQKNSTTPSAAVSFSAAKAIELAQQAQKLHNVHQASRLGERSEIRVVESHSSRDESSGSSEDENQTPALKGTLAAVSDSRKLTDRALQIQKMREASAMGKTVAYNHFANFQTQFSGKPGNGDDDDEDSMPLGGLKQAAAKAAAVDGSGANVSARQQHQKIGTGNFQSNGQAAPGISPQDSVANIARQHMVMPINMQMQVPGQQLAAHQGLYPTHVWHQRHTSGLSSPNASTVSLHHHPHHHQQQQQQQQQPLQQTHMAYSPRSPLVAGMHFSNNASIARAAMSDNGANNMGSTSITYGNIGLCRGPVLPDSSKHHAYTPSPLSQPPVTAAAPAMHADMRLAQYPSAMVGQMSMPSLHGPLYAQKVAQQPPQQQSQQQSMLATFIPSQAACRGSLSKNPLMRDINKIKEFSVKDYTARPTLLAEADSRRLAKKNMPGLGGTTCHSFQPAIQPPPASSQQPYQLQPQSPTAQRGHAPYHHGDRDHVEHHEYARSSRKSDMPRRRMSPRMNNYDDDSYEDISLSSGRSNGRYYGEARGGSRSSKMQGHRRHNHDSHNNQRSSNQRRSRYDHAGSMYNSDYEDHPSGREFRKVNPPPSSRNRRGIDRRRRDYRDDRHYDYYDYDDGFSDDYFSEEFNEWSDGEYSECFDSSAGAGGRLRRRVAQRRGQGDVHESRSKGHGREAGWKPLRSDAKGGARLRPAIPVNLDDPRDSNDVLPRSAHRSHRGSISGGSDVSENAKNAKPRSQFGRMLANMKRQAAPGSSMAESRAEIEDEIEESGKADNIPLDNESAKEGAGEGQTNGQAAFEASADAEPEMRSAAATPVTAPVAVA